MLALYGDGRAEFEYKYTGYVQLASRSTRPRLELAPLVAELNRREAARRGDGGGGGGLAWRGTSIVDSGPLLRLEREGEPLSKAARYGHPFERTGTPPSALPADELEALVVSFLEHGYKAAACAPRAEWTWADIHAANAAVDWAAWSPPPPVSS